MGEKIRDINTIIVGTCEFMIELNEGYSDEGRVIHVQNNKFRYLFQEKQFYKLCANFMRSKSELDYLRLHRSARVKPFDSKTIDNSNASTIDQLRTFLKNLDDKKIAYRVIEHRDKFATIIVSPSMYHEMSIVACGEQLSATKLNHPYGKMFGYLFLYQMNEFQLFLYKDTYIQVFYQLPCMSLEKNTWIPLDRAIQKRVWECDNVGIFPHMLDNENLFIYELCLCIFQFRYFSEGQINLLSTLFEQTEKKTLIKLLNLVFFSYTDTLMNLLQSNYYSEIINSYFTYKEY